jgi:UDP-N-acetyl-D-glucosamine dehydrogenase
VPFEPENVARFDAALIATDHDCVDYRVLVEHSRLVVDTRNVRGRLEIVSDKVAKA